MSPAVVRPVVERLAEVRNFNPKANRLKLLVPKQLLVLFVKINF